MEWLFSLALLPLLVCGAMCIGGMLVAVFGLRRTQQPSSDTSTRSPDQTDAADDSLERL